MRTVLLLLVLAGVGVIAWRQSRQRYETTTITAPSGRKFEVEVGKRACPQPDFCIYPVVYLSAVQDSAQIVAEARELLPWLETANKVPVGEGVVLVALRPGFMRLLPPTAGRYAAYFHVGQNNWRTLGHLALSPEEAARLMDP